MGWYLVKQRAILPLLHLFDDRGKLSETSKQTKC